MSEITSLPSFCYHYTASKSNSGEGEGENRKKERKKMSQGWNKKEIYRG
jgi:hypothetical protein